MRKGALINITGSENTPLNEIEDAIALVHDEAHEDANIIFGTVYSESEENEVKITVIATGFEHQVAVNQTAPPVNRSDSFGFGRELGIAPSPVSRTSSNTAAGAVQEPEARNDEDLDVPTFIRRQAD